MDSSEQNGFEKMKNQKITVCDHEMNGFKYENGGKKSDSFIVDLECFSNGLEKDPTTTTNSSVNNTSNSRITMQRSLSRKWSQRGAERKISDRDLMATSSSPRGAQVVGMPEKPISPSTVPMGSQDHSMNNYHQLPQHQITIKTGGVSTITDGRWVKRSSFKRTPPSWFSDPKRVVLFFATLSSMGTILLIYFTLSMRRPNDEEGILDWQ